jgi:hypothetical protein
LTTGRSGPRRFWLEFEGKWSPADPGVTAFLYLGVGVTGWDLEDCLQMITVITHTAKLPELEAVVEDVDVSTIDPWPNGLGVPVWRGIWFLPMNLQSSGRWDLWAPWRDTR